MRRNRTQSAILVSAGVALLLSGCESDNEHFCAQYSYYYNELTAPGVLPYRDLRMLLDKDVREDPDSKSRIALFVLEDIQRGAKPENETPQDFCLRRKRWEQFH